MYDLVKEKTLTDYRNRRFQQPYAHALTACSAVVEAPFWSSEARLAELESLTSDDVQACALPRPRPGRPPGRAPHGAADASSLQAHLREFLAHLLVEGAVVGNMTEAEAAAIFLGVAETLGAGPLSELRRPPGGLGEPLLKFVLHHQHQRPRRGSDRTCPQAPSHCRRSCARSCASPSSQRASPCCTRSPGRPPCRAARCC